MLFSNNRQLLDSLLRGSTIGYPSDSLDSCLNTRSARPILYPVGVALSGFRTNTRHNVDDTLSHATKCVWRINKDYNINVWQTDGRTDIDKTSFDSIVRANANASSGRWRTMRTIYYQQHNVTTTQTIRMFL